MDLKQDTKVMHAFRDEQDKYAGTIPIYRLKSGRVEACTELLDEPTGHNFSDSVYLGEVEVPGGYLSRRKAENVI